MTSEISLFDFLRNLNFFLPPIDDVGVLYYLINGIIFLFVYQALRMIYILLRNKQLSFESKRWSSAETKSRRVLILGDSTAVGTGATRAEETIAGRFARDFPDTQIVNLGKNGGLVRDLSAQIDTVQNEHFDMVIISVGGNDVWHMTGDHAIARHLQKELPRVKAMSGHRVIFLIYNNIGDAPLFPKPLQYFLKRRGDHIHNLMRTIARSLKVPTIELFSTANNNPFLKSPKTLFAADGIHPSSRGYQIWYHRMWLEMVRQGFRFNHAGHPPTNAHNKAKRVNYIL